MSADTPPPHSPASPADAKPTVAPGVASRRPGSVLPWIALLGAALAHWAHRTGRAWQGFAICYGTGLWPWLVAGLALGAAIIVAVSGVDKGVRVMSDINMLLACALLLFVLFAGPTQHLLNTLVQNIGDYLGALPMKSFDLYAYDKPSDWLGGWTVFYWAWWIAWSPFVGLFIARISRGRTIRELVVGALLVPTLVTILWMAVFGGTALKDEQHTRQAYNSLPVAEQSQAGPFTGGPILDATRKETTTAMFTLLERLDGKTLGGILSLVVCLLLAVHFVTAADAGTQVLCMLNSLGSINPPNWLRVLWCVLEGAIAASLIIAGGLVAIQMASIVVGLPIALYMLLTGYSLMRSLLASDPVIARQAPVQVTAEAKRPASELA